MPPLDGYKKMLGEFVAFKSISSEAAHQDDMTATAAWLHQLFTAHSFEVELWKAKDLNPVVWARYRVKNPAAQTALVYGHYDVQPASQDWRSDPFKLTERDSRLYGRGVADNKGQTLIHITTVIDLMKSDKLAHNVIFLLEGNEESGSVGLGDLLRQRKPELTCDHILISDGEIPYRPTIEASLRGGFSVQVIYRTAANDLHSGIYGGAIPNAADEIGQLISSFYNDDGRVAVIGFYKGIDSITTEYRDELAALYRGDDYLKKITGTAPTIAPGENFVTATGLQPTLQVTGLSSGYTGPGFANIIPATAEARINIRVAPSQSAREVCEAVLAFIGRQTPDYVDAEVSIRSTVDNAIKLATSGPTISRVQTMLEEAYGTKPLFSHSGGSIPVVSELKHLLGRDPILVGLANDDCNMHGIDENFDLGLIEKGFRFSRLFFSQSLT